MIHQLEILENILFRLPAKSIGRFRCVSKSWKSLLSQPQFIKTHHNHIKQFPREEESLVLYSVESRFYYSVQLKYAHQVFDEMTVFGTKLNFDGLNIDDITFQENMASCDGLVVLKNDDYKLLLNNPTTKEIKELPPSPVYFETMFGLGYDSITDDYKVVMLCFYDEWIDWIDRNIDQADDVCKMFIFIYSVKNGIWKRIENSQYQHGSYDFNNGGVFVEGCIHWLVNNTNDGLLSCVIVAFDVEKEEYYEVPCPSSDDFDSKFLLFSHLVVLGGCLCMSYVITSSGETEIWMMKEFKDKASWTKITIIDHEKFGCRPLCLLGKEQLVLVNDEHSNLAKLVMYNMEQGSFKDIVVQGVPNGFWSHLYFGGTFLESLVSPHCNNETSSEG